MPLHLKAQQEYISINVTCLKKEIKFEGLSYQPKDSEENIKSLTIHPSLFNIINVSAVAIKTPAFWSDKPELWFAQLESQFALGNISVDSTKFHYVIASLNINDLTCVSDIVLNPPQTDSYNNLKTKLIAQNADSETVRLKKRLSGVELGDKNPRRFFTQ
ncbi:hypothetical protein AVEN_147758-1 [Araneus ventricosus]|uniref:DUF7041 domain-containing protein n=1 Tax=Araneus ventricosus TaxID=182803 RepID=A0A4Y2Q9Y8_ARAVE|nr:hypothetical protein AVEN_147758-1 [Araneus ventricosus]